MLKFSFWRMKVAGFRGRQHKPGGYLANDEGMRLVKERLFGDQPYWWILAGGVHVDGFNVPDAPSAEKIGQRQLDLSGSKPDRAAIQRAQ